jgi:hypothetical protein
VAADPGCSVSGKEGPLTTENAADEKLAFEIVIGRAAGWTEIVRVTFDPPEG